MWTVALGKMRIVYLG
ncbi:unnamed protein product, partial [Rotaria sp. Silwood1]